MIHRFLLILCCSLLLNMSSRALAQALPPYNPSADIILVWNQVMLDMNAGDSRLLIPDQGGPTRTSRAFAIVSVAMFDAWNSINHKYTPYLTELSGYNSANSTAAVSAAAQDTLLSLFPQQAAKIRTAYTNAMSGVAAGAPRTTGIDLGKKVALAILNDRRNDNSNLNLPYNVSTLPGYHRPDPLHLNQGFHAPHWGYVDPFVIANVHSHLSPPPPALNSFEYAVAYQALANWGGVAGQYPTLRSPKDTITGIFWAYDGTPGLEHHPAFTIRLFGQSRSRDATPQNKMRDFLLWSTWQWRTQEFSVGIQNTITNSGDRSLEFVRAITTRTSTRSEIRRGVRWEHQRQTEQAMASTSLHHSQHTLPAIPHSVQRPSI